MHVETKRRIHTPSGATTVVTTNKGRAVRQSSIFEREKATALLMAVRPFSKRLQGMITFFRSKPNKPKTGVETNATPRPSIPEMKDRTKRMRGNNTYCEGSSLLRATNQSASPQTTATRRLQISEAIFHIVVCHFTAITECAG